VTLYSRCDLGSDSKIRTSEGEGAPSNRQLVQGQERNGPTSPANKTSKRVLAPRLVSRLPH
jgi:hypothetical protein